MANPADPGTFENWIADIAPITQTQPKTGDTGTMECWIADITPLRFYTKHPAIAARHSLRALLGRNIIHG